MGIVTKCYRMLPAVTLCYRLLPFVTLHPKKAVLYLQWTKRCGKQKRIRNRQVHFLLQKNNNRDEERRLVTVNAVMGTALFLYPRPGRRQRSAVNNNTKGQSQMNYEDFKEQFTEDLVFVDSH